MAVFDKKMKDAIEITGAIKLVKELAILNGNPESLEELDLSSIKPNEEGFKKIATFVFSKVLSS